MQVLAAQVVLPCSNLDDTLAFFTGTLGFRVESIAPAERPTVAVILGHGVRIRLQPMANGAPGLIQLSPGLPARFPTAFTSPA